MGGADSSVDVVGGNGDLRDIVEEVVQEDLGGQHRQEWEECRSGRHAEHIAEIRACAHHDIFIMLPSPAAGEDPTVQHPQATLTENQFRRLFCDVGRAHDGDANIGGMQRRRIVDSVTENPTPWPRCFNARMIRFFCAGDTRAKMTPCSATWPSAPSSNPSMSSPVTTWLSPSGLY